MFPFANHKVIPFAVKHIDVSLFLRLCGFKMLDDVAAGLCIEIVLIFLRESKNYDAQQKTAMACLLIEAWKVFISRKNQQDNHFKIFEKVTLMMAQAGQAKQLIVHGCLSCLFFRPISTSTAAELLLAIIPHACARHDAFVVYVGFLVLAMREASASHQMIEVLLHVAAKAAQMNGSISESLQKAGCLAIAEQVLEEEKGNKPHLRRKAAFLVNALVKVKGCRFPAVPLDRRSPTRRVGLPSPGAELAPLVTPKSSAKALRMRLKEWPKRFYKQRYQVYPHRGDEATSHNSLIFDSCFEMGNLAHVSIISKNEYELLAGGDVGSPYHVQWFYFCVRNTRKDNGQIHFHIVNFSKASSQFEEGMQPCVFSTKRYTDKGIGWTREGLDVAYHPNEFGYDKMKYTLSFSMEFEYDSDEVYIAYFFPYGYTDVMNDLREWGRKTDINFTVLTKTPGFRDLTFLSFGNEDKPLVVLTARAHPGEVPGSFLMRGAMNALVEDESLRDAAMWWVVPMLNPDGVAFGNSRTNIGGKDLNRHHNKQSQPKETQVLWKKINSRLPAVFIDFHAHSTRKGCFTLGNDWRNARGKTGVFPMKLAQVAPDLFDLERSEWIPVGGAGERDEGVCRVAAGLLGIDEAFTLEASFCSLHSSKNQITVPDLVTLGRHAVKAIVLVLQELVLAAAMPPDGSLITQLTRPRTNSRARLAFK